MAMVHVCGQSLVGQRGDGSCLWAKPVGQRGDGSCLWAKPVGQRGDFRVCGQSQQVSVAMVDVSTFPHTLG